MSNRRKTAAQREHQAERSWRCPKCKSRDKVTKEYPDENVLLHICVQCEFPQRVELDG